MNSFETTKTQIKCHCRVFSSGSYWHFQSGGMGWETQLGSGPANGGGNSVGFYSIA